MPLLPLAAIAFLLVTVVLHTLAKMAAEERRVIDLRRRALDLRDRYARRLAEIQGRGVLEVAPEHEPPAPIPLNLTTQSTHAQAA